MTRRASVAQLLVAALVVVLVQGPAAAQSPTPSPARGPSVNGEVTGALAAGSTLTIRIDGTMPGGWQALHLLEATIASGNQELDRLRFDIEDNKLTVGDQDLIVGTGASATSEYLRVSGADVIVTTGGANLSFEVDAKVVKTIPEGARFVLGVVDDLGESAEVTRSLAAPEGGGITWEVVIALIAAALFLGGFIGNLFASKRRPPVRPSVYETVRQRLERERAAEASKP
ncbi:MAG TPA: hypothetical protein VFM40_08515 [Actinomycetota bacterium]|nr:hypothetical protein [Actinomycetota bacterium]